MFERIIRFAIEQRWLVILAVIGMAGAGRLQLPALAHRRGARHHQRPGADQHRGSRVIRRWRPSSVSPIPSKQ
jgi:hypothetical protein